MAAPPATELAVVVVNYASHRLVEAALAPLRALGALLVVVDNWSSRAEREAVTRASEQHGWLLVTQESNTGFGAGVDAGTEVALARGCTSVLLLNPDARADEATVRALLEHSRREPLSLVAPVVVRPDGTPESRGGFVELRSGRTRGRPDLDVPGAAEPPAVERLEELEELEDAGRLAWLGGACVIAHRELLTRLGGVDAGYFLYWEDVDLSVRARQLGASLVVRHDLRVVHDEGGTQQRHGRAKSPTYYTYNCRNRLLFGTRHLAPRQLLSWVLLTPAESWAVLLRGGRRQLLGDPGLLLAVARGTAAGLGLAARSLLLERRTTGRRADASRLAPAGRPPSAALVVAVPTYHRPEHLRELLPLLDEQVVALVAAGGPLRSAEVVVVDNDPEGGARPVVDALSLPSVRYVHEPTPGLAAVRNRALDEALDADALVFFDDDERPAPGCLAHLLATYEATGAGAVVGAVEARYAPPVSPWVVASGFFERPRHRTGTPVTAARTGNLLLDARRARALGLRFDQAYATTGGEDTAFTTALTRAGDRLVWCDEAVAVDAVPRERATRRWVLRRSFSAGNTSGRVRLGTSGAPDPRRRAAVLAAGLARCCAGGLGWVVGVLTADPQGRARSQVLLARGAGSCLAAAGSSTQEYGRG